MGTGTRRFTTAAAGAVLLLAACNPSPPTERAAPSPSPTTASIEEFPAFPQGRLSEDTSIDLQAVLDDAIDAGTVRAATAAVAVASVGNWSGAAGVDHRSDTPMQPDAVLEIASIAKTMTAAAVMRLVEQGLIGLDDNASQHLPAGYGRLEVNGIRVRDLLGMRSGLRDPYSFDAILLSGGTGANVLDAAATSGPAPADVEYANLNYLLLGELVAHVTGKPQHLALQVLLEGQDLVGMTLVPAYEGAEDDWDTQSDSASLARWGYALYGGHVLAPASLDEMTSFQGQWYGLGTIDYSHPDAAIFAPAGIGHGGQGSVETTVMVVFPERATAVAILALGGELEDLGPLATALSQAALR